MSQTVLDTTLKSISWAMTTKAKNYDNKNHVLQKDNNSL